MLARLLYPIATRIFAWLEHGDTGRSELDAIRALLDGDADAAAIGASTWDTIGRP